MLRTQAHRTARAVRAVRWNSTVAAQPAGQNQFIAKRQATKAHAHETSDLWRKIRWVGECDSEMAGIEELGG
jgi:hypothetical protein